MIRTARLLKIFRDMNDVINCVDNVSVEDNTEFILSEEENEKIHRCFMSYEEHEHVVAFVDDCFNYCSEFSLTTVSKVLEG